MENKPSIFNSKLFGLVVAIAFIAFLNVLLAFKQNKFTNVLGENVKAKVTPSPAAISQLSAGDLSNSITASHTLDLSPYEKLLVDEFKQKLPLDTENLQIIYSPPVNQFLIALKPGKAEAQAEFTEILKRYNMFNIFINNPTLFLTATQQSAEAVNKKAKAELEKQVREQIESQNVRGIAVHAQETGGSTGASDPTLPDQGDTKYMSKFFVDLLHGVPDETDSDLTTIGAAGEAQRAPIQNPGGEVLLPTGPVGSGEIVVVQGIQVHKSIAAKVDAMLSAAKAAGHDIGGSGWRDPQEQIELRRQNCGPTEYDIYQRPSTECSPPTARPGTSNHESGLAIDFTCNGTTMRVGDDCYNWMADNAGTYGFYNYPAESWHWSVDGR